MRWRVLLAMGHPYRERVHGRAEREMDIARHQRVLDVRFGLAPTDREVLASGGIPICVRRRATARLLAHVFVHVLAVTALVVCLALSFRAGALAAGLLVLGTGGLVCGAEEWWLVRAHAAFEHVGLAYPWTIGHRPALGLGGRVWASDCLDLVRPGDLLRVFVASDRIVGLELIARPGRSNMRNMVLDGPEYAATVDGLRARFH